MVVYKCILVCTDKNNEGFIIIFDETLFIEHVCINVCKDK